MGLLPGLTRVVTHDSERFAALRSQALRVGAVAAGVVVALIPLAWIAVPLVFGTPYDPGRGPLVLLLIATAFPASPSDCSRSTSPHGANAHWPCSPWGWQP